MEDDERKQKLQAGKQKLAEFQKKKKKKKVHATGPKNDAEGTTADTDQSEASSSGDISFSDNDQTSGGENDTESSRTLLKMQSTLYKANNRIEELEEALTGKQLALDSVISENSHLNSRIQQYKIPELETAIHQRDDVIARLTATLTSLHEESAQSATQQMTEEIQHLHLQLQNASHLLETQAEKFQLTSQSLHEAKSELNALKQTLQSKNKENFDTLVKELEALRSDNEHMTEVLRSKNERIKGLEDVVLENKVNSDKMNLSVEMDLLRSDYELLTDTLKLKEERIKDLEGTIAENKLEIEMELLRGDNERMSELVKNLEEKLAMADHNILEKGKLIDSIQTEKEKMSCILQEKNEKLLELEPLIMTLTQEKEQLALDLDQLNEDYENSLEKCKRIGSLELELESMNAQFNCLQHDCQFYRNQTEELKNKINVQQDSLLNQKSQLDSVSDEKEQLGQRNSELKQELENKVLELQSAMKDKELMVNQCEILRSQLEEHQNESDEMNSELKKMEEEIFTLKVEKETYQSRVVMLEDQVSSLQDNLQQSHSQKDLELDSIHNFYKLELFDKDEMIKKLEIQIENQEKFVSAIDVTTQMLSPGASNPDWSMDKDESDSITEGMMESIVEDVLCQVQNVDSLELASFNTEKSELPSTQKPVAEVFTSEAANFYENSPDLVKKLQKTADDIAPNQDVSVLTEQSVCEQESECQTNFSIYTTASEFEDSSLMQQDLSSDDTLILKQEIIKLNESLMLYVEKDKENQKNLQKLSLDLQHVQESLEKDQSQIKAILKIDSDVSLDSEHFMKILQTLEEQKNILKSKLEETETERDRLIKQLQTSKTDEISDDSLNLNDSIDENEEKMVNDSISENGEKMLKESIHVDENDKKMVKESVDENGRTMVKESIDENGKKMMNDSMDENGEKMVKDSMDEMEGNLEIVAEGCGSGAVDGSKVRTCMLSPGDDASVIVHVAQLNNSVPLVADKSSVDVNVTGKNSDEVDASLKSSGEPDSFGDIYLTDKILDESDACVMDNVLKQQILNVNDNSMNAKKEQETNMRYSCFQKSGEGCTDKNMEANTNQSLQTDFIDSETDKVCQMKKNMNDLTEKLSDLSATNLELNDLLQNLEKENESMKKQYKQLSTQFDVFKASFSGVTDKNEDLTYENEDLKNKMKDLTKEYEDVKTSYSSLQDHYDLLGDDNHTLKCKFDQLQQQYDALVSENSSLLQSLSDSDVYGSKILKESEEVLKRLNVIEEENGELREQVLEKSRHVENLEKASEIKDTKIMTLTEELDSVTSEKGSLIVNLEELKHQMKCLEERKSDANVKILQLEKEKTKMSKDIEDVKKSEKEKFETIIKNLQGQNQILTIEKQTEKNQKDKIHQELEELQFHSKIQIETIEANLANSQSQQSCLKKELQEKTEIILETSRSMKGLEKTNEDSEREIGLLKNRETDLLEQCRLYECESTSKDKQLQDVRRMYENLEGQFQTSRQKVTKLQQDVLDLTASSEELRRELDTKESEFSLVNADLKKQIESNNCEIIKLTEEQSRQSSLQNDLAKHLSEKDMLIQKLSKENEETSITLSKLKQDFLVRLSAKDAEMEAIVLEKDELVQQCRKLESDKDELMCQSKDIESKCLNKLSSKDSEIQKLHAEVNDLKDIVGQMTQKVSVIEKQACLLKSQLGKEVETRMDEKNRVIQQLKQDISEIQESINMAESQSPQDTSDLSTPLEDLSKSLCDISLTMANSIQDFENLASRFHEEKSFVKDDVQMKVENIELKRKVESLNEKIVNLEKDKNILKMQVKESMRTVDPEETEQMEAIFEENSRLMEENEKLFKELKCLEMAKNVKEEKEESDEVKLLAVEDYKDEKTDPTEEDEKSRENNTNEIIYRLTKEKEIMENKLLEITVINNSLRSNLLEVQEEMEKRQESVRQMTDTLQESFKMNAVLQHEMSSLKGELDSIAHNHDDMNVSLAAVEQEIQKDEHKKTFISVGDETCQEMSQLIVQLTLARAFNVKLEEEISVLAERNKVTESEKKALSDALSNVHLDMVKKELKQDLETEVHLAYEKIAQLEKDLLDKDELVTEYQEKYQTLYDENCEIREEREKILKEIGVHRAVTQDLRNEMEQSSLDVSEIRREQSDLSKRMEKILVEKNENARDLAKKISENSELQRKVGILTEENDILLQVKEKFEKVKKERDEMLLIQESLVEDLTEMQSKYENVHDLMEETKEECNKEMEKLRQQLSTVNHDVSSLKMSIDILQSDLHAASDQKLQLQLTLEEEQAQGQRMLHEKNKLEDLNDKFNKDLQNQRKANELLLQSLDEKSGPYMNNTKENFTNSNHNSSGNVTAEILMNTIETQTEGEESASQLLHAENQERKLKEEILRLQSVIEELQERQRKHNSEILQEMSQRTGNPSLEDSETQWHIETSDKSVSTAFFDSKDVTVDTHEINEADHLVEDKNCESADREQFENDLKEQYEYRLRNMQYDMEEKYEIQLRSKQSELMGKFDDEKKQYTKKMETAMDQKIEAVKAEKHQEFVQALQKVKKDQNRKQKMELEKQKLKLLKEWDNGKVLLQLRKDYKEAAEARDALIQQVNQLKEQVHQLSSDEAASSEESSNQLRNQPVLDWEFSPFTSFDYDYDSIKVTSLKLPCKNLQCQQLLQQFKDLYERTQNTGFEAPGSAGQNASFVAEDAEIIQGFEPEAISPTEELEGTFIQEVFTHTSAGNIKRTSYGGEKSAEGDQFLSESSDESEDPLSVRRSQSVDPSHFAPEAKEDFLLPKSAPAVQGLHVADEFEKGDDEVFIGEGFIPSETNPSEEMSGLMLSPVNNSLQSIGENSGLEQKDDTSSLQRQLKIQESEIMFLQSQVKTQMEFYNKERRVLLDKCETLKAKAESEVVLRKQLEQEIFNLNEDTFLTYKDPEFYKTHRRTRSDEWKSSANTRRMSEHFIDAKSFSSTCLDKRSVRSKIKGLTLLYEKEIQTKQKLQATLQNERLHRERLEQELSKLKSRSMHLGSSVDLSRKKRSTRAFRRQVSYEAEDIDKQVVDITSPLELFSSQHYKELENKLNYLEFQKTFLEEKINIVESINNSEKQQLIEKVNKLSTELENEILCRKNLEEELSGLSESINRDDVNIHRPTSQESLEKCKDLEDPEMHVSEIQEQLSDHEQTCKLRQDISDREKEIEILKKDNFSLHLEMKEKDDYNEKMGKVMDTLYSELEILRNQLPVMKGSTVEDQTVHDKAASSEHNEQLSMEEDLKKNLQILQQELKDCQDELSKQQDDFKISRDELKVSEEKLTEKEVIVQSQKQAIEKLKGDNYCLNIENSEKMYYNEKMEIMVEQMNSELEDLREKLIEKEQVVGQLKSLGDKETKIVETVDRECQVDDLIHKEVQSDNSSQVDVEVYEKECQTEQCITNTEMSQLQQNIIDAEMEIQLLSDENKQKEEKLISAQNSLIKLQEEVMKSKCRMEEQETSVQKLEKTIEELSRENSKLRRDFNILIERRESLEKLLSEKDLSIQKLEDDIDEISNELEKVKKETTGPDYKETVEKTLKEKDSYIKKLEEHLLGRQTSERKVEKVDTEQSVGEDILPSKQFAFDHDRNTGHHSKSPEQNTNPLLPWKSPLDDISDGASFSSPHNENQASFHSDRVDHGLRSPSLSSAFSGSCSSTFSGSWDTEERILPKLDAEEDGHKALENKHFEIIEEISQLRRDLRETKSLYTKENALLLEELDREKWKSNNMKAKLGMSGTIVKFDLSTELVSLRQKVAVLQETNKMLQLENDKWLRRVQDQESLVMKLRNKADLKPDQDQSEEIFLQQVTLLQKQREDLMEKLKERETENSKLSEQLGDKMVLEENLRREKELLKSKLKERESIENELHQKKMELQRQISHQRKLEDIIYHKNQIEKELMKQKRLLEMDLFEIEAKLQEKEELLEIQKNQLLREIKMKDQIMAIGTDREMASGGQGNVFSLDGQSTPISLPEHGISGASFLNRQSSPRSQTEHGNLSLSSAGSVLGKDSPNISDIHSLESSLPTSDRQIGRIKVMLTDAEKEHLNAIELLKGKLPSDSDGDIFKRKSQNFPSKSRHKHQVFERTNSF